MASTTATATMAAAGLDKRSSVASSLQTPGSGTFPSEMLSPMSFSPGFLKKDDLKTPITPPSAYLDFLKQMSPAMLSPAPSSTSARFNIHEKSSEAGFEKPSITPPTSQPAPLSRHTSFDSNASSQSTASNHSTASRASNHSSASRSRIRPDSPRVVIPQSPFARPGPKSARTPRLHIPQSPFTPALGSSQTIPSPYSANPMSATPWSASFAPRDCDTEVNGKPGKMSVRQVVTRTVTYCRTPLDLEPAPKGKRRKVEVEDLGSKSNSDSEEPPVKQEKIDDDITPSASQPPKEL